jgi:hypothetical protein
MMMALIIFLSYAQTLWLKMHLKQDNCRASSEPFLIALPRNLSNTPGCYNNILLTTIRFGARGPSSASNEIIE